MLSRYWFLWVHDDRITNTVYWMSRNISKYFRMLSKLLNNCFQTPNRAGSGWNKPFLYFWHMSAASTWSFITYPANSETVWVETTAGKGMCENMVMVKYWQYKISFELHHNFLVSTRHLSFGTYFKFFGKCFIRPQNTVFIQIKGGRL